MLEQQVPAAQYQPNVPWLGSLKIACILARIIQHPAYKCLSNAGIDSFSRVFLNNKSVARSSKLELESVSHSIWSFETVKSRPIDGIQTVLEYKNVFCPAMYALLLRSKKTRRLFLPY